MIYCRNQLKLESGFSIDSSVPLHTTSSLVLFCQVSSVVQWKYGGVLFCKLIHLKNAVKWDYIFICNYNFFWKTLANPIQLILLSIKEIKYTLKIFYSKCLRHWIFWNSMVIDEWKWILCGVWNVVSLMDLFANQIFI